MDLKTEAQLTQEISEVWRMLEAERTGFSRIIAEKDKEIERLRSMCCCDDPGSNAKPNIDCSEWICDCACHKKEDSDG